MPNSDEGIVEHKIRFEILCYLDVSPIEHFNFVIKKFIRMASLGKTSIIDEAVRASGQTKSEENVRAARVLEKVLSRLAREGFRLSLVKVSAIENLALAQLAVDAKASLAAYVMQYMNDDEF